MESVLRQGPVLGPCCIPSSLFLLRLCSCECRGGCQGWWGVALLKLLSPTFEPCCRVRSGRAHALEPNRVASPRTGRRRSTWHVILQINVSCYHLHSYLIQHCGVCLYFCRESFYLFKCIVHLHPQIYIIKAKYTARLLKEKILKPHSRGEKRVSPQIKTKSVLKVCIHGAWSERAEPWWTRGWKAPPPSRLSSS